MPGCGTVCAAASHGDKLRAAPCSARSFSMSSISGWTLATLTLLLIWPVHNAILAAIFSWWQPRPRREMTDREPRLQFWIMIPALNEERVVAATVRAALALDSRDTPVRVLVVDDGSTDSTPQILAGI